MQQNLKSIVGNSIGTMHGNMVVGDTTNKYYQVEKIEAIKNQSDVNGNQNVVLQGITNSNIHVDIHISEELFQKNYSIIFDVAANTEAIKQTQDLHTDILRRIEQKLDGKPTLPKHLTLIPGVTKFFTGREQSLEQLHQRLFQEENRFILLVNGEGGVGKTTFAAEYCNKYQDEYNHIAWVVKETGIIDALFMLELPFKLPIEGLSWEQRLNQLIGFMQDLSEPCLLVIDNANDPDDIAQNMHLLRACNKFHLLITTRVTEYGDQNDRFQIDSLPFEEAKKLFAEIYRDYTPTDETTLLSIYKAVGGNTLVLELMAKNLSELNRRPNGYGLQNLLEDIQQKGILKITAQKPVTTGHWTYTQLQKQTPEEVITTLFDLTNLQEEEKLLLRQITLLPSESIEYKVAQSLFAGYPNFENLFNRLTTLGWITYNEKEHTFKFSPVVQQVIAVKTNFAMKESCVLVKNIKDQLINDGIYSLISNSINLAYVYVRYAESILNKLINCPSKIRIRFYEQIGFFYKSKGDYIKALEFFHQYNQLIKELYDNELHNKQFKIELAISYERLGVVYQAKGDYNKALKFFVQYNQLNKELYKSHPTDEELKYGLAISYERLGEIYQDKGDFNRALYFYNLEANLHVELYDSNPQSERIKNGLAISYEKKGTIYMAEGNYTKALEFFKLENEFFISLYELNPETEQIKIGLAISYSKLGKIYQIQGETRNVLDYYIHSNQLYKELYASNLQNEKIKIGLAISYYLLGEYCQSQKAPNIALKYFIHTNLLFKELYVSNYHSEEIKYGLAYSYEKLGQIHYLLGESEKVLEYFYQNNKLRKELCASNPQRVKIQEGLAISYYNQAILYKKMGERTKGKTNFSEWKNRINSLAENFPQIPKYQEWNKLEY